MLLNIIFLCTSITEDQPINIQIKILRRTGHRVKLLVPGTLSEDTLRKILLQLVAEKELIGLALLQDQGCAYVHLANEQAKSKLLEKKYLEVKSSLPALKKVETVSTSAPPNSTPASPKKAEVQAAFFIL